MEIKTEDEIYQEMIDEFTRENNCDYTRIPFDLLRTMSWAAKQHAKIYAELGKLVESCNKCKQ